MEVVRLLSEGLSGRKTAGQAKVNLRLLHARLPLMVTTKLADLVSRLPRLPTQTDFHGWEKTCARRPLFLAFGLSVSGAHMPNIAGPFWAQPKMNLW